MWDELLKFWLPIMLGSSVLASVLAFSLELGRSRYKEITEHNDNIKAIYNELMIIRNTLKNKELFEGIKPTNKRIRLPTGNMDYLIPKIAGKITSNTLIDIQQVQRDIGLIRENKGVRIAFDVKKEIKQIDNVLRELQTETKRSIFWKPKLE